MNGRIDPNSNSRWNRETEPTSASTGGEDERSEVRPGCDEPAASSPGARQASANDTGPQRFGLSRDAWGRLLLIDEEGVRHPNISAVPLFPLTSPRRWIALCDVNQRQIACVESPDDLPGDSARLLLEELSQREFAPIIERIHDVSSNSEPSEWSVTTDRGETRFVLNDENDVRRLAPHQVVIVDAHRIRYLIPDTRQLDARSRRYIEWYV